MIAVMIVPTGIGCEIGGHAGDATPAARLLASVCDKLILHPNIVNASDINEMPENSWYVEGSILDKFLEGSINLKETRKNDILVVVNPTTRPETINAVSAARATLGVNIIEIVELKTPLEMTAKYNPDGTAGGIVEGWNELVKQVHPYDFNALAIATHIECPDEVAKKYFENGGVNPWGRVEAMASKLIANDLCLPVAHAPIMPETMKNYNVVVDPRMSAEMLSMAFIHCVLKGLNKSPQINYDREGIGIEDVNCLISPVNCVGRPHRFCMENGVPIIAVEENKSILNDKMPDEFIVVKNYLEAVGVMVAMKERLTIDSITRPLNPTKIS